MADARRKRCCAPQTLRRPAARHDLFGSATSLVTGTLSAVAEENSVSTVGLPVPCSSVESISKKRGHGRDSRARAVVGCWRC
jgi:hypothetical protein